MNSLSKYFKLNTTQAVTHYFLGMCYMQKKEINKASNSFQKAESIYNLKNRNQSTLKMTSTMLSLDKNQPLI